MRLGRAYGLNYNKTRELPQNKSEVYDLLKITWEI
jgi:hypothetical protein